MQEDKEQIFDALDTVMLCLPVFCDMLATMTVKKDNMLRGSKGGFTNATDAADYLVKKGMPFRQAHEVIGNLVFYAIKENKALDELTLDEFKNFCDMFDEDIYTAISMQTCVNERKVPGGPAEDAVNAEIAEAEAFLGSVSEN